MKLPKYLPWVLILSACKLSESSIPGTYNLKRSAKTSFVFHADKTFSFIRVDKEPSRKLFGDSTEQNFRTEGKWELKKNKLILTSEPTTETIQDGLAVDQAQDNTSISTFNFWNQYGEAVPIRFIKFPPDRVKLHLNNTISFFAEDFRKTDTLEFHFYGYAPYKWLAKEGNQIHSIVLQEEIRPGFFANYSLLAARNQLKDRGSHATFKRVKKFRIE